MRKQTSGMRASTKEFRRRLWKSTFNCRKREKKRRNRERMGKKIRKEKIKGLRVLVKVKKGGEEEGIV